MEPNNITPNDTVTELNALASGHYAVKQYAEALPLLEQVVAIRRSQFGDRHPNILSSLNNLASLHQTMGNDRAAEMHFKEAIGICELLGTGYAISFTILQQLVKLYISKGEHPRAGALLSRWLELCQMQLPIDHFQTQQIQTALANLKKDGHYSPKSSSKKSTSPKAFGTKPKKEK
jgi:tetratricopeptide (TPR) repeat protein